MEYCRVRKIEIIPEIPSYSHSDYLVYAHPEIRELKRANQNANTHCPSNPDTYKLLFDIIDEAIDRLPIPLNHIYSSNQAFITGMAIQAYLATTDEKYLDWCFSFFMRNIRRKCLIKNMILLRILAAAFAGEGNTKVVRINNGYAADFDSRKITEAEAMSRLGISSRSTFYRRLRKKRRLS